MMTLSVSKHISVKTTKNEAVLTLFTYSLIKFSELWHRQNANVSYEFPDRRL